MNPKINDANITNYNIVADNGMIHVLDRVLMPNMELTCSECGMGFMTMEALNAHTKMGHITEKIPEPMLSAGTPEPMAARAPRGIPLSEGEPNGILCPVCGKPFKTNLEMQRYKMQHTMKLRGTSIS